MSSADIARDLAARGLRVVPLRPVDAAGRCTCGDANPKHKAARHPRWKAGNSTGSDFSWWEASPADTVGIDREASRIVTVEDDGDLARWAEAMAITFPPTFAMTSPAGNIRLLLRLPEGFAALHNWPEPDGWKVDILLKGRAPGPGVRRADGYYQLAADCPVADAPAALLAWLTDRYETWAQGQAEILDGVKPDEVPASVAKLLNGGGPADRSGLSYAIVAACFDAGLSQENAVWVAEDVPEIGEKFGGRPGGVAADVARCWGTLEAKTGDEPDWLEAGDEPDLAEWTMTEHVKRWRALAAIRGIPVPSPNGHGPGLPPVNPDQPEPSPAAFFSMEGGLLAEQLARAVAATGPLAMGTDNRLWSYRHGVWVPDPHAVRDRVAVLLRDRYRRSYLSAAEDITAAWVPKITSDPVEQYVNCRNGLLDWRTGTLYQHAPDVMSTVQLAVDWQPDATAPEFARWLTEVVPPDCIRLVLEMIGYLAYSGNPLHTAVMLTGSGRNGKGTLLRIIKAILGDANVTAASLHDLVNTRFTTASLYGKIANIAGDIDGSYLENTATLKAVTGGDLISAEHKGRDRFDFVPWCVPVFSANKIPASADTTAGYLSRWLIIPFPHNFEGREDRTVEARLHAELPGILAAGLRQLPELLQRGQFSLGDSARDAKAEFSRRVDQVRYWLHECCEQGDYPFVNRARLYEAYKAWVLRDGGGTKIAPLKAGEFYDRVTAAGVVTGRVDGTPGFRGIRVTDNGVTRMSYP